MVLKHVIVSIMGNQKVIMHQHNGAIMIMTFILFGSKEKMVWKFDRLGGFTSQFLLASYSAKMFKDRVRVCRLAFLYLCNLLVPILSKKDTRLRFCIPIEDRISLTLH